MTTISSGAESARENARKTDGKFGEQQRPEAEAALQHPEPQLERPWNLDAAKVELDGVLRRVDNRALSAIGATFKKHAPQVRTLELSRRFGTWQVTAARDENNQMHTFPDVSAATAMLTKDFHTREGVTALNEDLVHIAVADAYDRPDPSNDWTIAEASEAIGVPAKLSASSARMPTSSKRRFASKTTRSTTDSRRTTGPAWPRRPAGKATSRRLSERRRRGTRRWRPLHRAPAPSSPRRCRTPSTRSSKASDTLLCADARSGRAQVGHDRNPSQRGPRP